ncbi:MAG: GGDEF domain-containing protein [Ruminococcus sp.]|nr:GGDEF domain-containing protein [Ruminococcus sp.]
MDGINLAQFSLLCAALIISITSLIFTLIQQRTEKIQNKIYIMLISFVGLNALSQLILTVLHPVITESDGAFFLTKLSDCSYFLLHTALCPLFFVYVSCVCGGRSDFTVGKNLFYFWPFLFTELLVVLNPFTGWVYTYNEERQFVRQWGEYIIYGAAVLYLALSVFMLMFLWRALTPKRRTALIYFFVIVIAGVVVQLVNINIKCELFAEAVGLLGAMIAIESEDDRIDTDTGIYNRRALQNDLTSYLISRRRLDLICIKLTNRDVLERSGGEISDLIPMAVADFLRTMVPRYCIYSSAPGTFIVTALDHTSDKVKRFAELIDRRFHRPWHLGDTELMLNAVVIYADMPVRIKTVSDALYMADSPVPASVHKTVLSGRDLDYLMRRSAVENALTKGFDEGSFEVYYQPTYSISEKRLYGAEALIRLNDSLLGKVYPDEFIPIAEQNGLIDDIDDFVLREVCTFIKSGVPQRLGIESINVNLSVIECMQPGFVKHINAVTDEFGIDKKMINFEITESVAASNYELLKRVVNSLKANGFRFSMDDYGTGYSNMRAIFMLDFDVVKIDKSLLWSAEESDVGRIILESSVHMIKQMNREILVEGVETQQQLDLLKTLSVDYLQGYFFSRPVPRSELIALIEQNK